MSHDILPQKTLLQSPMKVIKQKIVSGMSILLAIILTCVLISLGEYILFDLNRSVNPAYDVCGQYGVTKPQPVPMYQESTGAAYPISSISTYTQDDCRNFALLIHAAFVIPVFLAAFLMYFFFYFRRPRSKYKILAWPYFIFSIVMMVHLLIETGVRFASSKMAVYLILILVAALLTGLVILLQKKFGEK